MIKRLQLFPYALENMFLSEKRRKILFFPKLDKRLEGHLRKFGGVIVMQDIKKGNKYSKKIEK